MRLTLAMAIAALGAIGLVASPAALAKDRAAVPTLIHPGYNTDFSDGQYRMLSVTTGGRIQVDISATQRSLASDNSLTASPSSPVSAQYQWPATYFLAAFKGDAVVIDFNDEAGKFRLSFDGQPGQMIIKPGQKAVRFDHLGSGYHTVRLETVSVPTRVAGVFEGFFVPKSETALEPPFSRRQIEFIGDSFAVGIGNHSPKRQCSRDENYDTTNTQDAWGPITARHFGADYQLNAISGRGIVRNYKGSSGDPIPVIYPFVLFDKKEVYRDDAWHPQIIVIALGRNDFLPGVHDGEKWANDDALRAEVVPTYVAFVKSLRARNPNASFVLMSYDPGIVSAMDQEVVGKLKSDGETRVGFLEVSDLEETGCGGHPTLNDENKISNALGAYITAQSGLWSPDK